MPQKSAPIFVKNDLWRRSGKLSGRDLWAENRRAKRNILQ